MYFTEDKIRKQVIGWSSIFCSFYICTLVLYSTVIYTTASVRDTTTKSCLPFKLDVHLSNLSIHQVDILMYCRKNMDFFLYISIFVFSTLCPSLSVSLYICCLRFFPIQFCISFYLISILSESCFG